MILHIQHESVYRNLPETPKTQTEGGNVKSCDCVFITSHFLLFFREPQRLPKINSQHTYPNLSASDYLGLCQTMSCLSPSSLLHNINRTHMPSCLSTELLLLFLTIADKPHEVVFPHALHITVPQPLLFPNNPTADLWEEEKVAQDFISSEGSDKSNSKISREALVLKVASSCWADVPAKKCA